MCVSHVVAEVNERRLYSQTIVVYVKSVILLLRLRVFFFLPILGHGNVNAKFLDMIESKL